MQAIERYLRDVLDQTATVTPWPGVSALPFYLRDRYEFAHGAVLGRPCVFVVERDPDGPGDAVRRHLDKVGEQLPPGTLCIYVVPALTSPERRRLIGQRTPFVVPGNQFFVPELGVDLRERFRRRETPERPLAPAAQVLLFFVLLRPWDEDVHPASLRDPLGYTPMTLSRAARELRQASLATAFSVGRERWLRFAAPPREIWEKAQPWLRNPVRRVGRTAARPDVSAPLAGLSALAQRTPLAAPARPVFAIEWSRWQQAVRDGSVPIPPLEAPDDEADWQWWSYDPALLARDGVVDPLSLLTSLREETDERVRQAMESLETSLW